MRGCSWTGERPFLPGLDSTGLPGSGAATSGLGDAVSLCEGDGGDVDTGDTDAAEIDAAY